MPNGTYGGVRGERISPLLDFDKKQRKEQNYNKFYQTLPYTTAFKIFA